jgi:hypothetical protein
MAAPAEIMFPTQDVLFIPQPSHMNTSLGTKTAKEDRVSQKEPEVLSSWLWEEDEEHTRLNRAEWGR